MDFINFWSEQVNNLVFQHFNGRDILAASLVSREWNNAIGRSCAMKKILVDIGEINRRDYLKCLVDESERKYRHLRAQNASSVSREIVEIIANPRNDFLSVSISQTEFEEEKCLEQIYLNTNMSIEQMKLKNLSFKSYEKNEQLPASYNFPKLCDLHLEYSSNTSTSTSPVMNKYFKSIANLTTLTLINGCDENFKNLIKNSKITKLVIEGCFYDRNFFKDLSFMESKLKEFVFNNILSSSKDDENLRYFNAFFWSQGMTLECFKTDALIEPDEIENAFKMPKLKELCVKGFHYNHEIMQIQLENLKQTPSNSNPAILTRFTVDYMDSTLFELLAIRAPNLKELYVLNRFDVDDQLLTMNSYFGRLESLKVEHLSYSLRERIIRKPETERTHLEKLLFANII